jgi:hypothetical protein
LCVTRHYAMSPLNIHTMGGLSRLPCSRCPFVFELYPLQKSGSGSRVCFPTMFLVSGLGFLGPFSPTTVLPSVPDGQPRRLTRRTRHKRTTNAHGALTQLVSLVLRRYQPAMPKRCSSSFPSLYGCLCTVGPNGHLNQHVSRRACDEAVNAASTSHSSRRTP